ncbi:pilus assembly protein TadG-related protein [Glycomyces sp. L485]|uniref:pilus assembly protein TadG-related protein n=1 Tax=Glycomyces sp. L485 TaxID=2909235 RepID=UPI00240842E8|nr:pilus assembly protein TadG-related protein [Glycomyces sp. L485]
MNDSTQPRTPCFRDSGYATAFVVVISVALMAVIGLAVDGGTAAAAHARAQGAAAEAARAGADEIDLDFFRSTGIVRLDPAAARTAAADWLDGTGHEGTASATDAEVTVTVTASQPTQILGIVGVGAITVTAEATASPRSPDTLTLPSLPANTGTRGTGP